MGQIALKVDVDTLRGTLEGVPRLLELFQKHQIYATFLFSLGPDHTGWALKRIFRPGFLKKVSRTSVVEHYGLKTLSYGVLLPGPDIGLRGKKVLQEVAQAQMERMAAKYLSDPALLARNLATFKTQQRILIEITPERVVAHGKPVGEV